MMKKMKMASGYEQVIHEGTGDVLQVDRRTGEALDTEHWIGPVGTVHLIPQEQAAIERSKEAKAERIKREAEAAEREKYRHSKPKFLFVSSDENTFEGLSDETAARAAYLATYMKYGTDELWANQREKLKRKDLPRTICLSKATADCFWNEVKGKFFYRDNDSFLHTTGNALIRGPLAGLKIQHEAQYQQLYLSAVKEFYEKITPRQHKRLGHVLKMLHYLNFEYNILCSNPEETKFERVIPMTVSDFCERIGYDVGNVQRLAKEYGKLTFIVADKQTSVWWEEVFCKFMTNGGSIADAHIYINPRLIYRGSNPRKVAAVGVSFTADAKPT